MAKRDLECKECGVRKTEKTSVNHTRFLGHRDFVNITTGQQVRREQPLYSDKS